MSAPKQYRKKPVTIEAIQYTGNNINDVARFVGDEPNWSPNSDSYDIETLEGTMTAQHGDWIIRGVQGEFYPCKPDIFEQTYEEAAPMTAPELNPEALLAAARAVYEMRNPGPEARGWASLGVEERAEEWVKPTRTSVKAYLAALPAPRTITTVEEIPATIQVISWEEEPEHECWKLSPDETFVGLIVKSGRSWSPADQYTLRVERTPPEGGGDAT